MANGIKSRPLDGWWVPLFVASPLFLLPFGRATELPMAVMAVLGIWQLLRYPRTVFAHPEIRIYVFLFACIWVPMLLALTDAWHQSKSYQTVLVFLRFLPMGVFVILKLNTPSSVRRLGWLVLGTAGVWVLDALIQVAVGRNLLGFPLDGGRLRGIFYPSFTLGNVLALSLPFINFSLNQLKWPGIWRTALLLPVIVVVIMSGSRNAWMMALFALIALESIQWTISSRKQKLAIFWRGLILASAAAFLLTLNPATHSRLQSTIGLASGDYQLTNEATSLRLPIWKAGLAMFRDHWINGIGPRGFRYEYPNYAMKDDIFLANNAKEGPTHPHQIVLEIGVESGALGLAGFAVLWWWLLRAMRRQAHSPTSLQLPWLIALCTALFPLNAGHALFGSFLSGIVFWLAACMAAARYMDSALPRSSIA